MKEPVSTEEQLTAFDDEDRVIFSVDCLIIGVVDGDVVIEKDEVEDIVEMVLVTVVDATVHVFFVRGINVEAFVEGWMLVDNCQ
ncbi:hypothetical protein NDU88_002413 [Pleurodeles waltl]|uniref:Uncharacterized protein n=1 Tax=Pleurodeles waltl TaxID=8319 RepID=A0AAV7KSR9_PLEWA|nr:hypothetical protein NDU88_002413 [Pleurodeles waltl]